MDTYMKYKGANMWPTHPLLSKPWCFQWARNEKKIMWMFFKSSHFFTFLWLIPNLKISQLENCRTLLRLKIFQMLLVAHMKILYTIFLCAISLNFTLILFYCINIFTLSSSFYSSFEGAVGDLYGSVFSGENSSWKCTSWSDPS